MPGRSNSGNSESVIENSPENEIECSDNSKVVRGLIQGFQPILFEGNSSMANDSYVQMQDINFERKESLQNTKKH